MVKRQCNIRPAAELATMAVPAKNILAGKDDVLEGNPDVH